jgi:hypothetical protein
MNEIKKVANISLPLRDDYARANIRLSANVASAAIV